jgi:hypothetical protein
MRTTAAAPLSVSAAELQSRRASPITTASAIPMIGVPSGATIIAPITVAVEWAKMPTAGSRSRTWTAYGGPMRAELGVAVQLLIPALPRLQP